MKWLLFLGGAALGVGGTIYAIKRKPSLLLGNAGAPGIALPPDAIATYVRQIRRYAFAASQDKSPVVGITHASYALILLETLEEVLGRDRVSQVSGVNIPKLRQFITKLQDGHAERLQTCDPHLQEVLRIERAEGMSVPGFVVAGAPTGA